MKHHFSVGQIVLMDRRQFIVTAYNEDRVVLVPFEVSGYVEVVRPYFLSNGYVQTASHTIL